MITEDYVSFETAKLLKEKGFDEDCHAYWDLTTETKTPKIGLSVSSKNWNYKWNPIPFPISAPTLQMVIKWLREEKGIAVIPVISSVLDNEKFLWDVKVVVAKTNDTYSQGWVYEKQEDACETAVKYCLENLI